MCRIAINSFENVVSGAESPLQVLTPITPTDGSDELEYVVRAIYIGDDSEGADLHILTGSGSDITLMNIVAGVFHPIVVRKVFATGTTVSGIIGGY